MKAAIFFCLILLACHEALSVSQVTGNCQLEDLPKDVRAGCNKVTCNKSGDGNVTMMALPCALAQCPEGKRSILGASDLSKTYPDCCPSLTCE